MNFYRSVLGTGGDEYSYTVKTVNAGGVETIHKGSCVNMFTNNNYFNSNITIGNNVANTARMFVGGQFNKPIVIPDSVKNCAYMFQACRYLNSPVTIGNNVTTCYGMFVRCNNFNQPITIPNNVTNCSGMFFWCNNFNQPLTIPSSVINCSNMFRDAEKFNASVNIMNGVKDCSYMFSFMNNFNRSVTIPSSVENMAWMIYACDKFGGSGINIKINSVGRTNFQFNCTTMIDYLINGAPRNKRIVIYYKDAEYLVNHMWGTSINFMPMINGYYNTTYNTFIYNNYTG